MGLLDKLRGVADGIRGGSLRRQEWIAVDGVSDSARLVRAVAAGMPRGTVLNVVRPRGAVAEYLRERSLPESNADTGDFYCPVLQMQLDGLAAVIESQGSANACSGIFVTRDGHHVLEAFRRDAGEDVVWLATDLPAEVITRMRRALEGETSSRADEARRLDEIVVRTRAAEVQPG
jgi:hypothetical protein